MRVCMPFSCFIEVRIVKTVDENFVRGSKS